MADTPLKSPSAGILHQLRQSTPARLATGRCGPALPTGEVLNLAMAHARARDAVNAHLDVPALCERLDDLQIEHIQVESEAAGRIDYVRNPELGRRLSPGSRASLRARHAHPRDVAIVVADGLSAVAIEQNCVPLLQALIPRFEKRNVSLCPVVVATQGRVALGDEIGEILQASLVLMLIGERPGLTSIDSIGAYLTFAPRVGVQDASRNCVSNIRPAGLAFEDAADKIVWLIAEAIKRRQSGVGLKDMQQIAQMESLAAPR